jgi:glycine dehydrogenase subunit 1
MTYISNRNTDRQVMLDAIGLHSLEDLFRDIPQTVKDRFRPLDLPSRSELEARRILEGFASLNVSPKETISFLGGGIYDHYIPSVVSHVTSRSEFYSAYTPYQPEVSQGTLTAMFEFQTLVCELTGMEIANASMYDGASALAEAALMAQRIRRTKRVAVARSLFPHYRRVLASYCWAADIDIVEIPYNESGRVDVTAIPKEISAFVLQTPNAFGVIESLDGLKETLGDPIALGLLKPPGNLGADIVVGEGQPLGLPASFGGPLLGLFATRKEYLRQTPGRIAGQTVDAEGQIGYTMAAQTREQHIRRERATSNICTNSALCALAATVYLASLGASGLKELAMLNLEKAHYLAELMEKLLGYSLAFQAPFFNEFTVRTSEDPRALQKRLKDHGILVEDPCHLAALGIPGVLRFAVTEKRTKEELDRVVATLQDEQ